MTRLTPPRQPRQPCSRKRLPPTASNVQKRQEIFLNAYSRCGNIRTASAVTGIARTCHNSWLRTHPDYVEKFAEAKEDVVEMFEDEADRRAYDGVRRKKFHPKTKRAYYELEHSDVLLIVRLKALAPEKYRERHDSNVTAVVAHSGQIVVELPALESDAN